MVVSLAACGDDADLGPECQMNTDCSGATPICDAAGSCVAPLCQTNAECSGATPVCEAPGICVEPLCQTNADCSGATPVCDAPGVCVEPLCQTNADCSGATPVCDAPGICAEPPRAGNLGWGDGSMQSVDFTEIHASIRADEAVDLEFSRANPNELWVLHRETPNEFSCTQFVRSGCDALPGSTTTIFNPGQPDQTETWVQDWNAWHFMRRPPAIAWGENVAGSRLGVSWGANTFFATCGEARTGNFTDSDADFIGPSLWTSEPSIYRNWTQNDIPAGWNGSHMDMLHASPDCTGIAHETGAAFWVANGQTGSLDRYDFVEDHGPGQADHSDGMIHRYAMGTLTRVAFTPGHIAFHEGKIYAADTGASRVVVFDPMGAQRSGPLSPQYEQLADSATFTGGTVTELVAPGGVLQRPSGLEIRDGMVYVSDAQTSQFHAFDLTDGSLVRSLETGLPPGSLAGFTFDAEGNVFFVDVPSSAVRRIDPK
ncbi:MAG: hypothetical protein AAFU79_00755 [Myxococcota bacterium]